MMVGQNSGMEETSGMEVKIQMNLIEVTLLRGESSHI
jgi:hypothetical protein